MFLLRKISKFIRGDATPLQLMTATLLGGALAFMPGFSKAPGLIVFLTFLLLVLNANLFLCGLVMIPGKLLYLLLLPLSFHLGRLLLDGPTAPLFTLLINGPVTAWFGFDYYAATGGLLCGLLYGWLCGFLLIRGLTCLRRTMAGLEENSPRYEKFVSKPLVKGLALVFFGGAKGRPSWSQLAEKKSGRNPIRIPGLILVLLSLVLIALSFLFLDATILKVKLREELEKANGATVEVESVQLDPSENRLIITGLAMADPSALDRNLFSAGKIEADISGLSLLRRKIALDRIEIIDAVHGDKRAIPGHLLKPKIIPKGEGPPGRKGDSIFGALVKAPEWKKRYEQAKSWLEEILPEDAGTKGKPALSVESLEERLAREVASEGYAAVRAGHRIVGRPDFTLYNLTAKGIRFAQWPEERLDLVGRNLSSQPRLLGEGPDLEIRSQSDKLLFHFVSGKTSDSEPANMLQFHYRGFPVNTLRKALSEKITFPLEGGTMDLEGEGNLSASSLEIPLHVVLNQSSLTLPKIGKNPVDHVSFPLRISGSLDDPRIVADWPVILRNLAKSAGGGMLKDLLKGNSPSSSQPGDNSNNFEPEGKVKSLFKGILNNEGG